MSPSSGQMWYPPLNKFSDSQQDQFARQGHLDRVEINISRKLIDDTLRINSNNNYGNRNLDILVGNVATTIHKLTRMNESSYICMGILQLIVQDKNLNLKTWSKINNDQGRKTNVARGCEDPLEKKRGFTGFSNEKNFTRTQKLSEVIQLELCSKKLSFNVSKKKRQKKGSTSKSQQREGGANPYFSGDGLKQAIAVKPQQYQCVPGTSGRNQSVTVTPEQNLVGKKSSIPGILRHNHSVSGNPGKKQGASNKSGRNKVINENQSTLRQNPSVEGILRQKHSATGKGPVKKQGSPSKTGQNKGVPLKPGQNQGDIGKAGQNVTDASSFCDGASGHQKKKNLRQQMGSTSTPSKNES